MLDPDAFLNDLEDAKEQEYDAEYMQAVSSLHEALVRSAGSADIAPRLATLGQDPGFAAYLSAEPDAEVVPQKFLVVAGSLPT